MALDFGSSFRTCFLVAVVGAGLLGAPEGGAAQGGDGNVRLTHLGVVVRDIERAAEAYAALAGIDPPVIRSMEMDHDAGQAHVAHARLSNIVIELIQPIGPRTTTYRSHLETRGQGVHHIGLSGSGGAGRLGRRAAEMASAGTDAEFIDLTSELGVLIETTVSEPIERLDGLRGSNTCVTHVGLVVRNIERSRQAYADLIGVEVPPMQQFDAATGPGVYTIFDLTNVSIELIQQIGDGSGTYADFLQDDGLRPHHLGLHIGGAGHDLDKSEQVEWLEQRGGTMGIDAGGFAYVDLTPTLGFFVEAMSNAGRERVYPHHCPAP